MLKFIGDTVLGIFPPSGEGRSRTPGGGTAALAAADALSRMADLGRRRRRSGTDPVRLGIALHRGPVMYGNVGTAGRLDVTVIGPVVNEASRLETLGKALGHRVIASAAFRATIPFDLVPLGTHRVREQEDAIEAFAVPSDVLALSRRHHRPRLDPS